MNKATGDVSIKPLTGCGASIDPIILLSCRWAIVAMLALVADWINDQIDWGIQNREVPNC